MYVRGCSEGGGNRSVIYPVVTFVLDLIIVVLTGLALYALVHWDIRHFC